MTTLNDIRNVYRGRQPQPIGRHRFFSVLVPVVEKDGQPHLLFEVRARAMESQPGEICFPGGNVEPGEDPADCALRETMEEIGIAPEQVELIGPGDTLYGYANYTLYTYMGIVPYEACEQARLAPEEVDEIFLVPLQAFFDQVPQVQIEKIYTEISDDFPFEKIGIDESYPWRIGDWEIPIYDVEGRIIWGLTARITANMVRVLEESLRPRSPQPSPHSEKNL